MQASKTLGWLGVLGLAIAPAVAMADDESNTAAGASVTQTTDDQVQKCDCDKDIKKSGKHASAKKSVGAGIGADAHVGGASVGVGVGANAGVNDNNKMNDSSSMGAQASSTDLDSIRAEERARAAEQFQAEEQRLNAEHQAELDRVRADEQRKSEADIAAAKADEDRRLESRRIEGERTGRTGIATDKAVLTPVGLYGYVGGGVTDFTQPSAAGTTRVGGDWNARLGIGSRSILGAEVAYVGGARDIEALGLNSGAWLLNNGVEGVARLNVPITAPAMHTLVEPYTFGGVGWQRYQLANTTTNTSSVSDRDDIMTVPMGIGLALGFGGFSIDGRATYRQAIFSDLLGSPTSSFAPTSLNSWDVGAAVGFEF